MKAIVFKGGGASAYCHIGVMQFIENLLKFEYYAGSSSGSIIAVLAAAGRTSKTMENIAKNIEFPKISRLRGVYNLITKYGWYSTDFIYKLITDEIGYITMESFQEIYKKKLVITACRNFKIEYFTSFAEGKEVLVAEAVARSCAFPYIFSSRGEYSDGGILNNFPYTYLENIVGEGNVLGIYLKSTSDIEKTNNIIDFTKNLFNCITADHSLQNINNLDKKNILKVKTTVKTFDLGKLQVGIEEGYLAAKKKWEEN